MNKNLENQLIGLWNAWLNEDHETLNKNKLAAEIAKFLLVDVSIDTMTNTKSDDEMDDVVDILVECNVSAAKLLQMYQSVQPLVVNESKEFQDKVSKIRSKLHDRINFNAENNTLLPDLVKTNTVQESLQGEKVHHYNWDATRFWIIILIVLICNAMCYFFTKKMVAKLNDELTNKISYIEKKIDKSSQLILTKMKVSQGQMLETTKNKPGRSAAIDPNTDKKSVAEGVEKHSENDSLNGDNAKKEN